MTSDEWRVAERRAGDLAFEALDVLEATGELGVVLGGDDHDELRVLVDGRDGEGHRPDGAVDDLVELVVAVHRLADVDAVDGVGRRVVDRDGERSVAESERGSSFRRGAEL